MKLKKERRKNMIPLISLPKDVEAGVKVKSTEKQQKERRKTMRLSKKARLMMRRKWCKPLIPLPESYNEEKIWLELFNRLKKHHQRKEECE